jgi:tRNA (guanine26-N2/guanine27-N2)-dimethyltransferase
MIDRIPTVRVTEGGVVLDVPKQSLSDPFHSPVFFNPTMRFSRSISSLAVGILKPEKILDGLCATGVRGLRYAKENSGVKKVFFADANPNAVPFIKRNASLNRLGGKTETAWSDFNDFCLSHKNEFDFVEVDPFGTPVPFLDSALESLKKPGVLSLTSTDLANLVKKNAPTLRNYGAKPLYNDFSHETALRILLGFVARKAGEKNLSAKPLLCFYEGHHAKVIARISKGKENSNDIGFVSYCDACLSRFEGKRKKCSECGNRLLYAGPLWMGDFCDKPFLKKLLSLNGKRHYEDERKLEKTLLLLVGEKGFPPWFFDVHAVADKFGLAVGKKMGVVLAELNGKGFDAVKTHFDPLGVKTNASVKEIRKVLAT